jgi:transglutaminase-like putative cysteine protease
LGLPRTLSADRQPIPADAGAAPGFLQASLTLPVGHPIIRQVLDQQQEQQQRQEGRLDQTAALAQQLIDLTRSQLLYAANQPAGSVLNAIASGRGECVDFADLLTTLARSQGIASRTVYGVAYSALPTPGFRFHAWNQILHQNQWHALDPTWDQAVADATHIALDDQTRAALASAMQQRAIAFTPVQ